MHKLGLFDFYLVEDGAGLSLVVWYMYPYDAYGLES